MKKILRTALYFTPLLVLTYCGVKGDPLPPLAPSQISGSTPNSKEEKRDSQSEPKLKKDEVPQRKTPRKNQREKVK